ncbi:hypothetical protein PLESTB_000649500 [Pleodorina starrii]|uniref:Uncharacterized protein n=1 Tax=Pleodorina starrii TaxID=330485 RepID=A0A9W6BI27_9CHLO|nr:hypothetical protein PLESTB_000649500 [Pleodorina starrii]GLC71622.1 hypothetical protein PLESTF_001142200 [Pleodorina starrii]
MFKRKKQAASASKPPPPLPPPPPSLVQRKSVAKLTVSECLQQAQGALQKLRTINPGDLQAFPLLNEIQRLVQQLKEATASLPPADKEAWSFQIADLEDEFRELADVVVSRADAAPKPEPRLSSPSVSSISSVAAGARTSKTQALLSPSNSGRVQQAVALFSRQDGFTSGSSQPVGIRRSQTAAQQPRIEQQQQQQQYPQQYSHQYSQQQQQQYPQQQQVAEQLAPSHAASSAASTPARSDSSYIYLTDEERELLARKQQTLLQKHFKYLSQQREADGQAGADARGALVSAQQMEPAVAMQQLQQQHLQQQHLQQQELQQQHLQQQQLAYQQGQVPLPGMYQEQHRRGPPSQYSSANATPHADARQSPAWSTTGVAGSISGAQTLVADGHAAGAAAVAPWAAGGDVTAASATSNYAQQYQGAYATAHPRMEPQQRPAEQDGGLGGGGDDDLFSGLEIVATDEQQPLAQPPQEEVALPAQAHAQQQQHSSALGPVAAGAGMQAAGSAAQADALQPQPQRAPTHSFRPAGHSMPHRFYAGSHVAQQEAPAGAHSIHQQPEPPPCASDQAGDSLLQSNAGAPAQMTQQLPQQQQQGFPQQMHYPQSPLQQGAQPLDAQRQFESQQHYVHQRQVSASAHGYHQARPAAESGSHSFNGLTSPPWRGVPSGASRQLSPFSQAPGDSASAAGPAASTPAASETGSISYPTRKKTSQMKLGYGIEDEANSQGRQQAALPSGAESVAVNQHAAVPGVSGGAERSTTGFQERQQQLGQAVGYQQQQHSVWAQQQQQSAWAQQQETMMQRPVSRAESNFQQQPAPSPPPEQTAQQHWRPDASHLGYAPANEQGQTAAGNPSQMPYRLQQSQQQQQQSLPMQQQYPVLPNPQLTETARHLQVHALEGQQPVQHHGQQQQYLMTAAQQQQQTAAASAVADADPGRNPQVWPGEAGQHAPQHAQHPQPVHQPQGAQYAQQAYPPQHAELPPHQQQQPQQLLLQLQQQRQQDPHQALQLQQGLLLLHHQQAQQLAQAQAQACSQPRVEEQAGRDVASAQPTQPYMTPLPAPTPEDQARTQLLQQIADSGSVAVTQMGAWPGQQQYAHASGGAGGSLASGYQGYGLAHAPAPGSDLAVRGHAAAPPSPSPATAASIAAASATPSAAAPARTSPYISASMQNAQSPGAADRAGAMPVNAPPRPAAADVAPSTSSVLPAATDHAAPSPAVVAVAAAAPSTPMHVATPAAQAPAAAHSQRGSLIDANAAAPSPALPMPLSSGGLRTRSRGLASGGGGARVSSGGVAADPAASLPAASSLPNLADLEAYLNNITGSVDACRGAAEHRAREMVSALATALSQAQKVEAAVQQQRRAVKAALAGVLASITQLEGDQAAAVEGEDFDTAAALDEQLSQLSYRRTSMDEQVQLLADALQRAAALRLQVLGRQAEVWRVTGAYLARLQSGQQQMAATLASQADREAQAAAMLHRAAQEALAQRRAALEERNAELANASAEVAAQVAAATAPAEAERQRRASARDTLQAEVESLRALLAAKEAAFAAAGAAVVEAAEAVRQQAAAYDQDLARLEETRRQLEAEEAQVVGHEQALQDSERQAEARAAAVEEHQAQLRLQADALDAAAAMMRCEAEALAQRVASEASSQEQRERLHQADEKAREDLKGLERCISDLSADLSRLAEQRGRLAAERAAVQEGLAGLQRSLPELEAAKRAAAANKDFREAARLSGELRALIAQADVAAAQLARVSGEMSELAATESGKVSELEELRAMVHDAQRHAAEAHHRYLVFSLSLSRAALEEAVGSELYEEAGALQAEVAAEEAEVLALERTWGLARPSVAVAAAAAAAARRRNSLEAVAAAAAVAATTSAALTAQFSRQSAGSLSAQSSRSMSCQLPLPGMAAQPHPAQQLHGAQSHGGHASAAGLKGFVPSSIAGSASGAPHPGAASPTSPPPPAWQQPQVHYHPPQHQQQQRHPQLVQQQGLPSPVPTGSVDYGSIAAAAAPLPQPLPPHTPASPHAYVPPQLPDTPSSPGAAAAVNAVCAAEVGEADAAVMAAAAVGRPVHVRLSLELHPQSAAHPSDPRFDEPPVHDELVYGTSPDRASFEGALQPPAPPQPSPAYPASLPHVTASSLHGPASGAAPVLRAEPSGRSLAAEAPPSSSAMVPCPLAAQAGGTAAAASASANPVEPLQQWQPGAGLARCLSSGRTTPASISGTATPCAYGTPDPHRLDASEPGEQQHGYEQHEERPALQGSPRFAPDSSSGLQGSAPAMRAGSAAPEGVEQPAPQLRPNLDVAPASSSGGQAGELEGGDDAAARASAGRPAEPGAAEPSALSSTQIKDGLGEEPGCGSAAADRPAAAD